MVIRNLFSKRLSIVAVLILVGAFFSTAIFVGKLIHYRGVVENNEIKIVDLGASVRDIRKDIDELTEIFRTLASGSKLVLIARGPDEDGTPVLLLSKSVNVTSASIGKGRDFRKISGVIAGTCENTQSCSGSVDPADYLAQDQLSRPDLELIVFWRCAPNPDSKYEDTEEEDRISAYFADQSGIIEFNLVCN